MLVVIAMALATGLISYLLVGTYSRVSRVPGILAPQGGELSVTATAGGRLGELRVRQGEDTPRDAVLAVIDSGTSMDSPSGPQDLSVIIDQQINARKRFLESDRQIRGDAARQRGLTVSNRLHSLDLGLEKLQSELDLQRSKLDLALKRAERANALVLQGFLSASANSDSEEQVIDQRSRLKELERIELAARREREQLLAEQKQVAADGASAITVIDREAVALSQESIENAARRRTVLLAPQAGTVTAVNVMPGQPVQAGQSVMAIAPRNAPLEAILFAPSRSAGFVVPGQTVRVRFAAYPFQKFGLHQGTVNSISKSAIAPTDMPPNLQALFGRAAGEGLYRITVSLASQNVRSYDTEHPLRAGMALEADLVQERRRIVEWLFEPLFGLKKGSL